MSNLSTSAQLKVADGRVILTCPVTLKMNVKVTRGLSSLNVANPRNTSGDLSHSHLKIKCHSAQDWFAVSDRFNFVDI
jgi:hypothetical protein